MKIDQIKIKQFGKAAVMFRAINAAGEVVQVRDPRGSRSVGGSEIGRLWRLAITFRRGLPWIA
jgi:hypothetical protein